MNFKNTIVCFIAILLAASAFAGDRYSYNKIRIKQRLSIAPVLSLYKIDPDYVINTKAQLAFCGSYKAEFLLGGRANFIIGLDYLYQGFSFDGYDSSPGHTYLYNGTFPYKYQSNLQEIQLPIGFKIAFNTEKANDYTPYCSLGVGARYLLSSYGSITNDSTGNTLYKGKSDIEFENQLIMKKLNGFLFGGLGIQHNNRATGTATFFEITYKYGLSRLYYQGYQNSDNVYIGDSYLAFTFGVKF